MITIKCIKLSKFLLENIYVSDFHLSHDFNFSSLPPPPPKKKKKFKKNGPIPLNF